MPTTNRTFSFDDETTTNIIQIKKDYSDINFSKFLSKYINEFAMGEHKKLIGKDEIKEQQIKIENFEKQEEIIQNNLGMERDRLKKLIREKEEQKLHEEIKEERIIAKDMKNLVSFKNSFMALYNVSEELAVEYSIEFNELRKKNPDIILSEFIKIKEEQ